MEIRRQYSFLAKAWDRLVNKKAPNLCGLDVFSHGEQGAATAEIFTLACNHGPKGPVAVARDVLTFVGRDDDYVADWGRYGEEASILLSCMMDATPEELAQARELLSKLRQERTNP